MIFNSNLSLSRRAARLGCKLMHQSFEPFPIVLILCPSEHIARQLSQSEIEPNLISANDSIKEINV